MMNENKLISWDWYDEALLGLSCYTSLRNKQHIEYDRVWGHVIKYLRFLEAIVTSFKSCSIVILDIGCADGRFARMLSKNTDAFDYVKYIGVDIRGNIIGNVIKHNAKLEENMSVEFIVSDVCESWLFAKNSADVIILSQVLRYMSLDCGVKVLRNSLKTIKPKGIALITHSIPSAHDSSDWTGYIGGLTINEFRILLIKTGFFIIDQFPVETISKNRQECEKLAVSSYPKISTLPLPLRVLLGLNLNPNLAQQQAFLLAPSRSCVSTEIETQDLRLP